jgi:hypothetical protein
MYMHLEIFRGESVSDSSEEIFKFLTLARITVLLNIPNVAVVTWGC